MLYIYIYIYIYIYNIYSEQTKLCIQKISRHIAFCYFTDNILIFKLDIFRHEKLCL